MSSRPRLPLSPEVALAAVLAVDAHKGLLGWLMHPNVQRHAGMCSQHWGCTWVLPQELQSQGARVSVP